MSRMYKNTCQKLISPTTNIPPTSSRKEQLNTSTQNLLTGFSTWRRRRRWIDTVHAYPTKAFQSQRCEGTFHLHFDILLFLWIYTFLTPKVPLLSVSQLRTASGGSVELTLTHLENSTNASNTCSKPSKWKTNSLGFWESLGGYI